MRSLYKSALQHFFGGGAVIVPSSQWQADRSHSGIPVTLWVLTRLFGALSTLTCWGLISWPVVFLFESSSGMMCVLTSRSLSDGEVVFFLYDQINLTRAKGKKKKKRRDWNSPIRCLVEPSCNAFCFPSAWCSCKVENYKSRGGPKLDRNDSFLLAHNFLLCKSRWAYFNQAFSFHGFFFYSVSKFLYSKTLNAQVPNVLSQHRLNKQQPASLTKHVSYFITPVVPRHKRLLLKLLETAQKEPLCSR